MNLARKIDPRTKLTWCVAMIIFAFLPYGLIWECGLFLLLLTTELAVNRSLRDYRAVSILLLIVASQIFVIQLLFNREGVLLDSWWIFRVYSGFAYAAALGSLRTSVVAFAAMQMLHWSSSKEMTCMLVSWKIPYRYAMLVELTARFLPLMKKEYSAICDSQSVRGMPNETAVDKIRLLFPTFLPFLFRSIRRSSEIALTMEMRGFGVSGERTFLTELNMRLWEKLFVTLLIAGMLFALVCTLFPLI